MTINTTTIKVKDIVKNFHDDGEGGVFAYDGQLTVRPPFQREFIYNDKQREAVIQSVLHGFPLNIMYWTKDSDGKYSILDGQQRTISICQYFSGEFPVRINGNDKFYHNLNSEERERLENYGLLISICEGNDSERLEWFRIINIAGETLTNQELLNATYTGPWLTDAKTYFSKRNCAAKQMSEGYMKGNPIRQDLLEKVLSWVADRDGLESGQMYMAKHQMDPNANDIWTYFQTVMAWVKIYFPTPRKGITDCQDWGILYNRYGKNTYNIKALEKEIEALTMDDDVTNHKGIIGYVLSGKTQHDEKLLSIRAFTLPQKMRVYEKQGHKCPICVQNGVEQEYAFDEMEGDHIVPWSKGGQTVESNLQMLCKKCNNAKGGR